MNPSATAATHSAAELLDAIEAGRARLRALVRGRDAAVLAARPANGSWSLVENVRHLLFAEQLHLGRFAAADSERGAYATVAFSPMGLGGPGLTRKFAIVGTQPTDDVQAVLRAWDAAHRPIAKAIRAAPDDAVLRLALARNLRHLGTHTRIIERRLRAIDRASRA